MGDDRGGFAPTTSGCPTVVGPCGRRAGGGSAKELRRKARTSGIKAVKQQQLGFSRSVSSACTPSPQCRGGEAANLSTRHSQIDPNANDYCCWRRDMNTLVAREPGYPWRAYSDRHPAMGANDDITRCVATHQSTSILGTPDSVLTRIGR